MSFMTDKSRDWLLVASPPVDAGYLFPADPVKTAYYLIEQAGGGKQARAAITAAGKLDKRRGGRPREINDEFWLRIAANLQHRAKIQAEAGKRLAYWKMVKTEEGAIEELAGQYFGPDAAGKIKSFTRRLLRSSASDRFPTSLLLIFSTSTFCGTQNPVARRGVLGRVASSQTIVV